MEDARTSSGAHAPFTVIQNAPPANAVERYKASLGGDGLRILELLPQIIPRGTESLTPAEKELLKCLGVFYRRPTPGKFMMRIRMPNGFARAEQLRAIDELSRRLGNGAVDILVGSPSFGAGQVEAWFNSPGYDNRTGGAVGFVVSAPTQMAAGDNTSVTVTAVDALGDPVPGFLGTVDLKWTVYFRGGDVACAGSAH